MTPFGGLKRRHQKGSAVLFIVAWLVFAILALGAWALFEGQAGIGRMQAQYQADAVSLGAGVASRVYGPTRRCNAGFGLEFLQALHNGNGGVDGFVCPLVGEGAPIGETRTFGLTAQEVQGVEGQFGGLLSYAGDATREAEVVSIHEFDDDQVVKELPNVVLILDMSRSMNQNDRITALRRLLDHIVNELPLRPQLAGTGERLIDNANIGVVFFDRQEFSAMRIPITAPAVNIAGTAETVVERLKRIMQLDNLGTIRVESLLAAQGQNNGIGGTNYDEAFRIASDLFDNAIGGGDRFTIMITDGEPRTDSNLNDDTAVAQAAARARFINELAPVIDNAYMLFLGDPGFLPFAETVSGPVEGSLTSVFDLNNLEDYFNKFEFYFQCWSGPLNPRLVLADFPFEKTWAWVRSPQEDIGHPLDYAQEATDVGGDPDDPNKAANSLFYLIADPEDGDGVDELAIFYSEFICRKIEDDGHLISLRHGWASIIDHNLQVLPYGIDLPDFP